MTCYQVTKGRDQISLKQRINSQALDGFYTCTAGYCIEIFKPYTCERRCSDMSVHDPQRNVVILNGDRLILTSCRGSVTDKSSGELVWNPSTDPGEILLISCTNVRDGPLEGQLLAMDCINASLVEATYLKDNFTHGYLMSVYQNYSISRRLPPSTSSGVHQVPQEYELTIYNRSKLLVNLEV